VIILVSLPFWTVFHQPNGCGQIGAMMLTGSGLPWRRKGSNPVFLAENLVENRSNTTNGNIKDATVSKWRDRRTLD
jgi:hypothetical protein